MTGCSWRRKSCRFPSQRRRGLLRRCSGRHSTVRRSPRRPRIFRRPDPEIVLGATVRVPGDPPATSSRGVARHALTIGGDVGPVPVGRRPVGRTGPPAFAIEAVGGVAWDPRAALSRGCSSRARRAPQPLAVVRQPHRLELRRWGLPLGAPRRTSRPVVLRDQRKVSRCREARLGSERASDGRGSRMILRWARGCFRRPWAHGR
jgi:hypothetical protein